VIISNVKSVASESFFRPPIGLIICDEGKSSFPISNKPSTFSLGHRLKSSQSKVNQMFDILKVSRRVILSGTPIQNNLEELHAMVCHIR